MKLLIAHGDAGTRFALRQVAVGLASIDLEPVEAGEGRQTIELLLADDAPDLAVVDWDLPGCGGPELCRQVRARRGSGSPYIILLTRGEHHLEDGFEAGADDCVRVAAGAHELQARISAGRRFLVPPSRERRGP